MHQPSKLKFIDFGKDPLSLLAGSTQASYLCCYLADLDAKTVVVEPHYFDRDYLAEFSAFYSTSSRGYPNVCQRLHFFSDKITRTTLTAALARSNTASKRLRNSYLGFTVLRPIEATPLGRTVLAWYPDSRPATPRISNPSRAYTVHLAGFDLSVHGLAWQQQDTGVGACATIGLWTMLHSSAFDDHHAIPTTADITRSAHKTASLGSRVFPSTGLSIHQLLEAIKEQKLAPVVVDGDLRHATIPDPFRGFSKRRFASFCAAFIRSGYPVLVHARLGQVGQHAACAVGFRESISAAAPTGTVSLQDDQTEHLYVHDDNLGPSVRFRIEEAGGAGGPAILVPDPPPARVGTRKLEPTLGYGPLVPQQLIIGVHDDVRLVPDQLHFHGLRRANELLRRLNALRVHSGLDPLGLWLSTRFIKLSQYIGNELDLAIPDPKVLSRTRLALVETVAPMSLHLGIVRIAADGAVPLVDLLFDTTDSVQNNAVFGHVLYIDSIAPVINALDPKRLLFGTPVAAY